MPEEILKSGKLINAAATSLAVREILELVVRSSECHP
jgi:hypothetical protein